MVSRLKSFALHDKIGYQKKLINKRHTIGIKNLKKEFYFFAWLISIVSKMALHQPVGPLLGPKKRPTIITLMVIRGAQYMKEAQGHCIGGKLKGPNCESSLGLLRWRC